MQHPDPETRWPATAAAVVTSAGSPLSSPALRVSHMFCQDPREDYEHFTCFAASASGNAPLSAPVTPEGLAATVPISLDPDNNACITDLDWCISEYPISSGKFL